MITMIIFLMAVTYDGIVLFDFSKGTNTDNWLVVNDGVMGGRSQASFGLSGKGNGLFKGNVSLENNGGFSSVQYRVEPPQIKTHKTIAMRLKGDGKNYQVRIREKQNDYFSYIATFPTTGEWETIEVPLNEMHPSFRGRKLDLPNFNGNTFVELTILIANKKEESFAIELNKAYLK